MTAASEPGGEPKDVAGRLHATFDGGRIRSLQWRVGQLRALSNARAVLRKPSRPDLRLMYPPYGRFARRLMRALL